MDLRTALSIPIIATVTLIAVYFAIAYEYTMINSIIFTYFAFIGTLTLKKYLYLYFKNSANFAKFDY